ncbi:GNAT family N-acetyltransferase [Ekhidna sp.]|jgi:ribosomal protein S18 acetylase RimI-like enzyme|uniref:GNAT family N-acetyltransferase n=1 Tax=Ekhidna sp. TaxID=2608089 RepID=UPI0032ECF034
MGVTVEIVNKDQLATLRALCLDTFTETYGSQNTKSNLENYLETNFNHSQLKNELDNPQSEYYFVKVDGTIAGYLKVNVGDAQTEIKEQNGLEIERIYVSKAYQGQRLGQALFEKAMERAWFHKTTFLWLGVWDQNTNAIGFYERNGFKTFDTHVFQLGDEMQTDLMMKLELV